MEDVEILAKYLRRRFKGRVETFDTADGWSKKYSNLRIYKGNKTIECWVQDGDVEIHNYRPACKAKFHMADPDFETKLFVFLTDRVQLKPSKLKAEY